MVASFLNQAPSSKSSASALGDLPAPGFDFTSEFRGHFQFVLEVIEKPIPEPVRLRMRQFFDRVLNFDNGAHGMECNTVVL